MRHKYGSHLGLRKDKRPLQTIGCSGRLTTATLPILTKEPTVANLIFRLIGTQIWGDVSATIFR